MEQQQRKQELLLQLDQSWSRLIRQMGGAMAQLKGELGISPTQFFILRLLLDQGSMTITDLAQSLGVSLSAVSGFIDQLEKLALVQRRRGQDDRRVVEVELTRAGKEIFAKLQQARLAVWQTYTRGLEPEELAELARLLTRMFQEVETSSAG